ncbi:MAG: hypothetical protein H0U32_05625, partial [Thermoleophilaceae bacterium]|nr:hypothetical protein [Thermoleophilaceae bacterium]
MCFKNLPIEFDEQGNARLKAGAENPWSYETKQLAPIDSPEGEEKLQKLLARNGHIRRAN